jgi:DNA-directed RNA polymerase specialized sigma24 family protein
MAGALLLGGVCAFRRLEGVVNLKHLAEVEYLSLRALAIHRCSRPFIADPQGLADEAITRLIAYPRNVDNVEAFLTIICKNVVSEEYRRLDAARAIGSASSDSSEPYDQADYDACFAALSKSERLLLQDYVKAGQKGLEGRRQLAGRYGVTYCNLRKQVQRIRDRLKACVEEKRKGTPNA